LVPDVHGEVAAVCTLCAERGGACAGDVDGQKKEEALREALLKKQKGDTDEGGEGEKAGGGEGGEEGKSEKERKRERSRDRDKDRDRDRDRDRDVKRNRDDYRRDGRDVRYDDRRDRYRDDYRRGGGRDRSRDDRHRGRDDRHRSRRSSSRERRRDRSRSREKKSKRSKSRSRSRDKKEKKSKKDRKHDKEDKEEKEEKADENSIASQAAAAVAALFKNKGVAPTPVSNAPAPVVVDPVLLERAKKLICKPVPLGVGDTMLKSIINDAMVQRGLAVGESVTSLEIKTQEGGERAAEMVFRKPEEATECLEQLNEEIEMMGTNLKLERPEGYQPLPENAVGCGLAGASAPAGPAPGMMGMPGMMPGMYGGMYGGGILGLGAAGGGPGAMAAMMAAQQQRQLQLQQLQLQQQQLLAGGAGAGAAAGAAGSSQLLLMQAQQAQALKMGLLPGGLGTISAGIGTGLGAGAAPATAAPAPPLKAQLSKEEALALSLKARRLWIKNLPADANLEQLKKNLLEFMAMQHLRVFTEGEAILRSVHLHAPLLPCKQVSFAMQIGLFCHADRSLLPCRQVSLETCAYLSVTQVCVSVVRARFIWQKSPVHMAKESCSLAKRSLLR